MKRIGYILLIFSCFTIELFSQVAKDDFASINKAYAAQKQLSMKVKYEVYKNKTTTTVFSTETGEIKQNGTAKYTRTGNIETVETETYRLLIDHEDKNISLLGISNDETEMNKNKEISPVDLEKIISICSKVEFKKINDTQNSYTLVMPGEEYEAVQIIYNVKTFFIEKMILQYAEKQNLDEKQEGKKETPRMEITYSDFNTNPDYKKTPFNYDAFIEKRNGKLVAKTAYKEYTVNDQSFTK
jgi:hypothetical protein